MQKQLCQKAQPVIVQDAVERIPEELTETKKLLTERDSQLKDLSSEVNQLQSKLKQSEDISGQLAEDIDRLKSELFEEKEKRILREKSFSESEKLYEKTLLKFSERELSYKEKEMQLTETVQDMQKQLCQKAQPVIVQDAVERIPEELTETKKLLTERDSLLKEVGSEVNQLQSKLKQSEKTLLKFSERELAYKEKEMQLTETVQDMQKQLRQKARELELLKMEHSSNLSMLNIKQLTVDDLTKRCSKMSAEIAQMKKTIENVSKLEMMWKQKEAIYQEQIRHLQAASKDEKQIDQLVLKNHVELRRNTANAELVTDDVENLTGATAEGGEIQKESSVEKVETDSCSTDQFGGNDSPQSMKTCKLCSLTFPKGTAIQVIKDHLHSHQKVCPICNKHLELKCTQQEFELHVSEHLANTIKFTDGRKICPMCDLEFPTAWAQDQFEIHVNEHFTDTLRP